MVPTSDVRFLKELRRVVKNFASAGAMVLPDEG